MLLRVMHAGLLSDLLCHMDKSEAKQLERASKTVRVFFTDSVKKELLGRVANFYTKGVRVTNGVYDIYTMHGNTHVQLDASDPTHTAFFTIDGSRYGVHRFNRQFLENAVGIWIRNITMLNLRSGVGLVTVQADLRLVVERGGDLPQLTMCLHPILLR